MSKSQKPSKNLWKNDAWNICYTQFINSLPSLGTRQQYNWALRRFFGWIKETTGKEQTPDKITRRDIEVYLHEPLTKGQNKGKARSPKSYNVMCLILKSFYSWCAEYRIEFHGKQQPILRGAKPTDGVKLMKEGEVNRDMEETEIERLFSAIDRSTVRGKRDFAIFLTLLVTGRRRCEITKLCWGDFEQISFFENGRKRNGWIYYYTGKTDITKTGAEMPQAVMDAIQNYLEADGRWEHLQPTDPVFIASKGGKPNQPIQPEWVSYRFKYYARMAGLPENVVLHSLRWENAYLRYLENGNDIIKVQDEIGWKSAEQAIHYIRRRKRRQAGDPTATKIVAKFAHL